MKQQNIFVILIGVIVLVIVGVGGYLLGKGQWASTTKTTGANVNANVEESDVTNENTEAEEEEISAEESELTNENEAAEEETEETDVEAATAGITWLDPPQQLSDLQLFQVPEEGIKYYRIATLDDGGEMIYSEEQSLGLIVNRFRKNVEGNYFWLQNHSEYPQEQAQEALAEGVEIDAQTSYPELVAPQELMVNQLSLQQRSWLSFISMRLYKDVTIDGGSIALFGSTTSGDVYVKTLPVETEIDNGSVNEKVYFLKLADTSIETYTVSTPMLADDGSLIATLNTNGKSFEGKTFSAGFVLGACGASGDQYATVSGKDLVAIGETEAGMLYTITDQDSSILKNAYESYKVGRDFEGSTTTILTYEEFVSKQPLFLWVDAMGDNHVFMDTDFAPLVECGKPVIYLYPERTTKVSVIVGAEVTESEPEYEHGWNVLAKPNGELTLTNGEVFGSLYWEGKGYGRYPRVEAGRVVATENIEQELRNDLATLGLTDNEAQDFLDFWLPRMPTIPYVRLTWFETAEMNRLAPLRISPRPDSVIRIFLDFAGQETPTTTLPQQHLTALPRNGFTVVEWGGLLLGEQ